MLSINMTASSPTLNNPPIVEAVVDIECDLPPTFDLAGLEAAARTSFGTAYPVTKPQFVQSLQIEAGAAGTLDVSTKVSTQHGLQALQFLSLDEKQLVQLRAQGFSFNRLAPYSNLDDYLVEIERTWKLFLDLAHPIQIRRVHLRYINRILLPLVAGRVELDDYLKQGPRLPDEDKLAFAGFLYQYSVVETSSRHQVNVTLAAQPSESNTLPIIFDIQTTSTEPGEPGDWTQLEAKIRSLRSLKNMVFFNSLSEKCLSLFQQ